jgi:hypothetical protein
MRAITDVLRDIRKGRVVEAASTELAAVVQAVLDTGKKGALTLKLTVTPQGKNDSVVVVDASISTSIPREKLPGGSFYTTLDGDLLTQDPTAGPMFAGIADRKAV